MTSTPPNLPQDAPKDAEPSQHTIPPSKIEIKGRLMGKELMRSMPGLYPESRFSWLEVEK